MIRTKKIVCILIAVCLLIGITGKYVPGNAANAQELPKDGTYSIPVHLWNATKDAASLGNDALEQTAKLVIDKGECRLYLRLKGISMMGLQGYLMQLDVLKNIQWNENGYPVQYEYKDTAVVSRYAVVDLYNGKDSTDEICRGKYYPKVAAVDVAYQETYTWAHIYVPVMGSMGFGDQLCRIRLDYDQMKEMTQQEKADWEEAQKDEVTPEATPSVVPDLDKTSAPASATPSVSADELASPKPSEPDNANTPAPSDQNNANTPSGSENTVLDKNNLANGTYSLEVSLWKEAVDQLSMGNPALQTMALLTVKDGIKHLQIGTRLMTFGTITAGLHSFQVKQKDGTYRYANVDASENILEGKAIPSLFSFDLPDTSDYLAVKIDPRVAIMNNQIMDARLKLDWSTLRKVADDTQIEKEDTAQAQTTAKSEKKTTRKKSTTSSAKNKKSKTKKATTAATKSTTKDSTAGDPLTANASEDALPDYDIEQDEEELSSDAGKEAGNNEEDMLSSEMSSEGGESSANASDEAGQDGSQNNAGRLEAKDTADQKKEQRFLTAFCLGGSMLLSVINVFFVCTCIWMQFYKKRKEE